MVVKFDFSLYVLESKVIAYENQHLPWSRKPITFDF